MTCATTTATAPMHAVTTTTATATAPPPPPPRLLPPTPAPPLPPRCYTCYEVSSCMFYNDVEQTYISKILKVVIAMYVHPSALI